MWNPFTFLFSSINRSCWGVDEDKPAEKATVDPEYIKEQVVAQKLILDAQLALVDADDPEAVDGPGGVDGELMLRTHLKIATLRLQQGKQRNALYHFRKAKDLPALLEGFTNWSEQDSKKPEVIEMLAEAQASFRELQPVVHRLVRGEDGSTSSGAAGAGGGSESKASA